MTNPIKKIIAREGWTYIKNNGKYMIFIFLLLLGVYLIITNIVLYVLSLTKATSFIEVISSIILNYYGARTFLGISIVIGAIILLAWFERRK